MHIPMWFLGKTSWKVFVLPRRQKFIHLFTAILSWMIVIRIYLYLALKNLMGIQKDEKRPMSFVIVEYALNRQTELACTTDHHENKSDVGEICRHPYLWFFAYVKKHVHDIRHNEIMAAVEQFLKALKNSTKEIGTVAESLITVTESLMNVWTKPSIVPIKERQEGILNKNFFVYKESQKEQMDTSSQ